MIRKSILLCIVATLGLTCGSDITKQQEINFNNDPSVTSSEWMANNVDCNLSTNSYLTGCPDRVIEKDQQEESIKLKGGNGDKDPSFTSSEWIANEVDCNLSTNSYLTGCPNSKIEKLDTSLLNKAKGGIQDLTIYM